MNRKTGVMILCGLIVVSVCIGFFSKKKLEQSLTCEVYIWQRSSSPGILDSMQKAEGFIKSFAVLFAEISRVNGALQFRENPLAKNLSSNKIIPVIRIGQSVSDGGLKNDCDAIISFCEKIMPAHTSELQLDYDCPSSKLSEYRELIEKLRQKFPRYKITFTALPTWLETKEFSALAKASSGFVLQVHSLSLPKGNAEKIQLCDIVAAKNSVQKADQFKTPFRVALPTYSIEAILDANGKCLSVFSENYATSAIPQNTHSIFSFSDAPSLSRLVQDWQKSHPTFMSGIIWYRLPISSDVMNWQFVTWQKVSQGINVSAKLECELEQIEPLLFNIVIQNTGTADALLPNVSIEANAELMGDGLNEFVWSSNASGGNVTLSENCRHPVIAAGQRKKIAWLRTKMNDVKILPRIMP